MVKIFGTKCIKCGSSRAVKNGFVSGWQRYKCKNCGYQYTKQSPHGYSIVTRLIASNLYAFGMKKNEIAAIVGVTPTTVARWIKKYHIFYLSAIAPVERRTVLSPLELKDWFADVKARKTLAVTRTLPSGARIDILLHIPNNF